MELLEKITKSINFDYEETFNIYKTCSSLIISDENSAINLLIHIINHRNKFDKTLDSLLADLIESLGFYPYLEKENLQINSTESNIRKYSSQSKFLTNTFFHDEQKRLLEILNTGKNLVVSAPTSFGKSLLIEEIVASNKYKNIVIIQPTLALLDETRKKLIKYNTYYNLIIRTSQKFSDKKGNIFLLTAERVNEYPSFPNIDFIIVDEFYKFSAKRDDERSFSLNVAFYKLWKKNRPRFYLLGPNIRGITENFESEFNAIFYKTDYKLVACIESNILNKKNNPYSGRKKKEQLFELLLEKKDEQSLIYCKSPAAARKLSYEFLKYINELQDKNSHQSLSLIEWINTYIDIDWSLSDCLKRGIGFHDGILPKHISTSIIDYFNNYKINYLFCTTTIIEGVNTSAKNIMYFDETKGKSTPIDYFDYSNIKGRAGRLMQHYVGNIYHFNIPPIAEETIIDIPFFEQNPIQDEVLIHLKTEDIKNKHTEQYIDIQNISDTDKAILIKNGINIKGQLAILKILRECIKEQHATISWAGLPSYESLKFCLQLAWDHLLTENETQHPITRDSIVYHAHQFSQIQKPSLQLRIQKQFIHIKTHDKNKTKKTDYEYKNLAILDIFRIQKHWIEYKIPKLLSVMHNLQEHVCLEHNLSSGSYLYFASILENDFLPEELMLLVEYGVPNSAIDKLRGLFNKDINSEEIISFIKSNRLYDNQELLQYEKEKIKTALSII